MDFTQKFCLMPTLSCTRNPKWQHWHASRAQITNVCMSAISPFCILYPRSINQIECLQLFDLIFISLVKYEAFSSTQKIRCKMLKDNLIGCTKQPIMARCDLLEPYMSVTFKRVNTKPKIQWSPYCDLKVSMFLILDGIRSICDSRIWTSD